MIGITFFVRIIVTIGFIMASYWSLQAVNLEKILLKNRVQQARMLFALVSVGMGITIANALFSLSEYMNSVVQLLLSK